MRICIIEIVMKIGSHPIINFDRVLMQIIFLTSERGITNVTLTEIFAFGIEF